MTKLGMDAETIRQLANQMDGLAKGIESVRVHLDGTVERMRGSWWGQDAQAFEQWWTTKHRPALLAAAESVHGLARSALNNATDQERVSGGGAAAHAGATTVTHTPAPHQAAPTHTTTQSDQSASVKARIAAATNDSGHVYPTTNPDGSEGGAPGQCYMRVVAWVQAGGGHLGGGDGPIQAFQASHAVAVPLSQVQPGDILQRVSSNMSTPATSSWSDPNEHTLMVTGVNPNGTFDIVQGNSDWRGKVSSVPDWQPGSHTPSGTEWIAYRLP